MNLVAASLFVLTLICIPASSQVRKQKPPTAPLTQALTPRQIAERATNSLVIVLTTDTDGEPFAQGSGFFFKPGLVATNLHVLKRAWQGEIELVSTGVRYRISDVIAVDRTHDICVLKIEGVSAPPLSLNTSRQDAVGDDIYVAGNPEGLKGSFSKGIISAIRKDQDLIQIDASISPGSSGGPVINSRAEVIGIAVGGLTSGQHLNFAIPAAFLSSLPLGYHLPLYVVGALAVNDKENEKLRGPVRTVLVKKSTFGLNCNEREARLEDRYSFDVNGNETESMHYDSKGGTVSVRLRI